MMKPMSTLLGTERTLQPDWEKARLGKGAALR
jgi:hypothetical protein